MVGGWEVEEEEDEAEEFILKTASIVKEHRYQGLTHQIAKIPSRPQFLKKFFLA